MEYIINDNDKDCEAAKWTIVLAVLPHAVEKVIVQSLSKRTLWCSHYLSCRKGSVSATLIVSTFSRFAVMRIFFWILTASDP